MNDPIRNTPEQLAAMDSALGVYRNPHPAAHGRWSRRMAATFTRQNAVPASAVKFSAWDLCVLQARTCVRRDGRLARRLAMASFRPVIDLGRGEDGRGVGTGRVSFVPVAAHDLAEAPVQRGKKATYPAGLAAADNAKPARVAVALAQALEDADPSDLTAGLRLPSLYWLFRPEEPPVFEPAHAAEEWAEAELAIDGHRAWPAAMFARPRDARHAVHPVDGSPDPWAAGTASSGEATAGSWVLRDGVAYPSCQLPAAVVTFLAPHLGRSVRNPALAALGQHRLVDLRAGSGPWRDRYSTFEAGRRTFPRPEWRLDGRGLRVAANPAARFQEDLEARFLQEQAPADLGDVLRTAATVAAVSGVPFDASDADHSDLAVLLQSPWTRALAPGLFGIQVVNLGGVPDPQTLTFTDGVYDAELYDLGAPGYDQAPEGRPMPSPSRQGRRTRRDRCTATPIAAP